MNSKKKIALVGKGVIESGRFGKMTPTLDDENCDPQLAVESKEFKDIVYVVRSEYPILKLYVFWNYEGWKEVSSSLDNIIYPGLREEYNELREIVKAVNELNEIKIKNEDL